MKKIIQGEKGEGMLVYDKIGSGEEILFAFHGFGQDKSFFDTWNKKLGSKYSIYAFDLFYHGDSTRPLTPLSKEVWANYMDSLLAQEKIEQFSVLGYSLGGRFALTTALSFPERTKEITLVAPDGIYLTVWFKLATTPVLKSVFKYLMLNPDKLEKWLRFNEKVRILNTYVSDFIRKEMGTPENRRRVYISWNHFKTLGYRRSRLIRDFRKYSFKRQIILGSKDHIIKPKDILPIIEQMGRFKVTIHPKKHHQLLDEQVAELLAENG